MAAQDIASRVRGIIRKQLDVAEERLKPESFFVENLGGDSLSLMELTLALEEEFELDIPDEDAEKMRTVRDAVEYIEKHVKARSSA